MIRRTTIVVIALLSSACMGPEWSVWRHPDTGQEHLCNQWGGEGEKSYGWSAYADCKSRLEDLGFVRVRRGPECWPAPRWCLQ